MVTGFRNATYPTVQPKEKGGKQGSGGKRVPSRGIFGELLEFFGIFWNFCDTKLFSRVLGFREKGLGIHGCFQKRKRTSWPKSIQKKFGKPGFSQPAVPFGYIVPYHHISVSAMIRGNHLDPPLYIPLF